MPSSPRSASRDRLIGAAALVAAALFWAGNYIVGHAAVAVMNPASLVLLRWAVALIPLIILAQVLEKPRWREQGKNWRWHLVLGLLGLAGYTLLLYAALTQTSALNASLINAVNPALIMLASVLVLRERLTGIGVVGIAVALLGVVIVLTDGRFGAVFAGGLGSGDLLMVAAIVCWTAYTIVGRKAPAMPSITSVAIQAAIVVVLLIPVVAVTGLTLPTDLNGTLSLLYIALFPSILSYIFWNRGLKSFAPGQAGVFLNLITVFTVVIAVLLGQALTGPQILGGLLVLAGVVLTSVRR